MVTVTLKNGTYRGKEVHNQTFEMVHDVKEGAKGHFITVRPNKDIGVGKDKIRINVLPNHVKYDGLEATPKTPKKPKETDKQIKARINDRFEILEEMTDATIGGDVRAMIVVGPPGVGKSYGVEKRLEKASLFDKVANLSGRPKYNVMKGAITPIGLYQTLFHSSDKGNVLVFDDCDGVLGDELALNILKAALDSGKKRMISWMADSNLLTREGIPDRFEFKGSIIFITNINFNNVTSKKLQDHLAALQSRCHYLDLAMNTMRERFLRIESIHETGELFKDYEFENGEADLIIDYMKANKDRLNEVSLRMALKIADLTKVSKNWTRLAETTVMKHSF